MELFDMWKSLFIGSIFALVPVRLGVYLQDRIRGRELPPRFFGPFSKGQLIVYVVQCFGVPTAFTLSELLSPPGVTDLDVLIVFIALAVLLLGGEVAAYFLDRHFGGK